jgi:hypothetical protein
MGTSELEGLVGARDAMPTLASAAGAGGVLRDAERRLDRLVPGALFMPRDEAEVVAIMRECFARCIAVTPRGAGTGNYGQAMPLKGGVVLDLSRLDQVLWCKPGLARIQAGAKLIDIDRHTREKVGGELRFHPSTKRTATIGGFIAGGSSGIGLTAIQLAKAFGAKVLCTVGNADKVAACLKAGADVAIDYRQQDFVAQALAATEQKGVNIILDMVGGDYMQRNLQTLAIDGRLVQIAFLQHSKTEVDWIALMVKRLTFTGSTLRPRSAADKAQMAHELKTQVWPLLEKGQALPVIHQVFDLDQAAQAHALMESSTHIGKIMLKVAGG